MPSEDKELYTVCASHDSFSPSYQLVDNESLTVMSSEEIDENMVCTFKDSYELMSPDQEEKSTRITKARNVLSDSGANIAAAPTILAEILDLVPQVWPRPKKIVFGNGAAEWSSYFIDIGSLFGRVALLDNLVNTIFAVPVANKLGYSVHFNATMQSKIFDPGGQLLFQSSIHPLSGLYYFDMMDMWAAINTSPLSINVHKVRRLTKQLLESVMDLHQRMNHPSALTMASALKSGVWHHIQIEPEDVHAAFKHSDCLACLLSKTNRLPVSEGLGSRPPDVGFELSCDYISVNVTARGGFTGYFLLRCLLRGGLFLYLTKSKDQDEFGEAIIAANAYYSQFNKKVCILRVDAGKVEATKGIIQQLNLAHISVEPSVPEKQFQNFVERSVQTMTKGTSA